MLFAGSLTWGESEGNAYPGQESGILLYDQTKCLGSNLVKYIFIFRSRTPDFLVLFPGLNTRHYYFLEKEMTISLTIPVCPNLLLPLEKTPRVITHTGVAGTWGLRTEQQWQLLFKLWEGCF